MLSDYIKDVVIYIVDHLLLYHQYNWLKSESIHRQKDNDIVVGMSKRLE
jgi:hypothetical protein